MASPASYGRERSIFAHHVRALLARQDRDDREAIGATLRRRGFRVQHPSGDSGANRAPPGRGKGRALNVFVDFHRASPLTGRDRQSGSIRVPHFDMKPVVRRYVPTSADGKTHARYNSAGMTGTAHFDYVTDGAKIELGAHYDYIRRETAVEHLGDELVIDMLDEYDLRRDKNRLAVYSNIPGGRERQRSLFEAAERIEPAPKTHYLKASTASLEHFEFLLKLASARAWLRPMVKRLRVAREKVEREALSKGRPVRHVDAVVAEVTPEDAYDRLTWFDQYPRVSSPISWEQGRSGRVQYRFVAELPAGLSPYDRHAILQTFCDQLSEDDWMVVGAIHQPDQTNDNRNFHMHVDGYDRPAKWLEKHECWDFEHCVRRNGKDTYPHRQKKVRYGERSEDRPPAKVDTARLMRERFIATVNDVVGDRQSIVRYVAGTYADNQIGLTPLEHMGNRAIGAEKNGIATEVGTRNARRIVQDELAACEARAQKEEASLADELAALRPRLIDDPDALVAVGRYADLKRRAIQRRLQADLADVVITMARSRAEAVLRDRTPGPGRRRKTRENDVELAAAAHDHLRWVERRSPTREERDAERRLLNRLDGRVLDARSIIERAILSPSRDLDRSATLRYRPRTRAVDVQDVARPSNYDQQKRGRLAQWFEKHVTDVERLIIDGDEVQLGGKVPPSIDTFMRQFAHEEPFQRLLLDERERRQIASAITAQERGDHSASATTITTPVADLEPIVATRIEEPETPHASIYSDAPTKALMPPVSEVDEAERRALPAKPAERISPERPLAQPLSQDFARKDPAVPSARSIPNDTPVGPVRSKPTTVPLAPVVANAQPEKVGAGAEPTAERGATVRPQTPIGGKTPLMRSKGQIQEPVVIENVLGPSDLASLNAPSGTKPTDIMREILRHRADRDAKPSVGDTPTPSPTAQKVQDPGDHSSLRTCKQDDQIREPTPVLASEARAKTEDYMPQKSLTSPLTASPEQELKGLIKTFRDEQSYQQLFRDERRSFNEALQLPANYLLTAKTALQFDGVNLHIGANDDVVLTHMRRLIDAPLGWQMLVRIATTLPHIVGSQPDSGWTKIEPPSKTEDGFLGGQGMRPKDLSAGR